MEKMTFKDLVGNQVRFDDNLGREGRTNDSADLVKGLNNDTLKIVSIFPQDKVNENLLEIVRSYAVKFPNNLKTHQAGNAVIIFVDMPTFSKNVDFFNKMSNNIFNEILKK